MPYMTNGKRDYKKEAKWEKTTHPERATQRAERKKARYEMQVAGKVSVNDGKQVDHKKELIRGGSNSKSNLRVVSAKTNLHKEAVRKQQAAKRK